MILARYDPTGTFGFSGRFDVGPISPLFVLSPLCLPGRFAPLTAGALRAPAVKLARELRFLIQKIFTFFQPFRILAQGNVTWAADFASRKRGRPGIVQKIPSKYGKIGRVCVRAVRAPRTNRKKKHVKKTCRSSSKRTDFGRNDCGSSFRDLSCLFLGCWGVVEVLVMCLHGRSAPKYTAAASRPAFNFLILCFSFLSFSFSSVFLRCSSFF